MSDTTTERAWAAGFFDGEGTACLLRRKGRKPVARVSIDQVDPEALTRFKSAMGVGNVNGPYAYSEKRPNARPHYKYTLNNLADIIEVYAKLEPYLGTVKREQFEGVIDYVSAGE